MRSTLLALSALLLSFTTTSALNLRVSGKKGFAKDINIVEENTSRTLKPDSNYAAVNPQKHRALYPSIHKWYSFRDFCDKKVVSWEEDKLLYDCPGYIDSVDSEYINNAWQGILISGPQSYRLWTAEYPSTTTSWADASSGAFGGFRRKSDPPIVLSFQYNLFEQDFPATTDTVMLNLRGVVADFQVLAYNEVGDVIYDKLFLATFRYELGQWEANLYSYEVVTIKAPGIATVKIIPDPNCHRRNCYLRPGSACFLQSCWVDFVGFGEAGGAMGGEALGIGALTPIGITNFTLPSPVLPPIQDDHTFVSTSDAGLDTKCTYRSGSPLIFSIPVPRVIGNRTKLFANGLLPDKATFQMSVFSMDTGSSFPERDQVSFNGNMLEEILSSQIGEWTLNSFQIPFEWIRFPAEPGEGLAATPENNIVIIDIDPLTADGSEQWCTAIDWASLTIGDIPLPVVMAHGIRSDGDMWEPFWEPRLEGVGIPYDGNLDMGPSDSIQSNAKKIERKIAQAKRRWGVKQVTAVAHSKGGLDMRHYIENAKDVHQLIQLGTPNLGTPLADFLQLSYLSILVWLILTGHGPIGPLSSLFGTWLELAEYPGWAQLTTLHMLLYNSMHGHNPDVHYTSVAGIYTPDDLLCSHISIDGCIFNLIVGPGDTIVPVASQLGGGLGYISGTVHYSHGSNIDATHSGLAKSEDVFKIVQEDVFDSRSLQQMNESYNYSMLQSKAGVVTEGESVTFLFVIDEIVPEAHFIIFYAGSLEFLLTSPSSTVIDKTVGSDDSGIAIYDVITPERGSWRITVTGVNVVESIGYAPFVITVSLLESSIKLKPGFIRSSVPKDVPLILTVTLTDDGIPIKGANASALIVKPDGTIDSIVLQDDGIAPDLIAEDGVYTGSLTSTEQVGSYRSVIVAENLIGTQFSREGLAIGTVSSSAAVFNGNFSDFGVDENLDGLYEKLVINAGVNTDVDGVYRIFGQLQDSAGNEQTVSFESNLSVGPNHVQLVFDGHQIFQNRIDGPYSLTRIRLAEEDDISIAILDDLEDAFLTTAYKFDQFQPSGSSSVTPTTTEATTSAPGSTAGTTTDIPGSSSGTPMTTEATTSAPKSTATSTTDNPGSSSGTPTTTEATSAPGSTSTSTTDIPGSSSGTPTAAEATSTPGSTAGTTTDIPMTMTSSVTKETSTAPMTTAETFTPGSTTDTTQPPMGEEFSTTSSTSAVHSTTKAATTARARRSKVGAPKASKRKLRKRMTSENTM